LPQPENYKNRLPKKVAIVTGAGAQENGVGTGSAIACLFAAEGAKVCLVDIDRDRAEVTLELIKSLGSDAFICQADVTDADDCEKVIEATLTQYGHIDILVNNVGITGGGTLETLNTNTWDRVLQTNLTSAMLMSKYAMASLIRSGGNVLNIASLAALRAHGANLAYSSSKAAMITMTNELAVIYGPQGVRSNAIAPGHIYTPLVQQALNERQRSKRRLVSPLQIEGDAWDVATAAVFLASDEARFITAVCLPVDGGVSQIAGLTAALRRSP